MADFTIRGDADTYLNEDIPANNYGNADRFYLGHLSKTIEYVAILRRDFSAVIPAGSTIDTASIYLYVITQTGLDLSVTGFRIKTENRDWVEGNGIPGSGADWEDYKGTDDWQVAGGSGANDYDTTKSFGALTIDGTGWFSVDCKTFMQDAVDNRSRVFDARLANYTVVGEGQSSYCSIYSREYGTEAARWYITGTYTAPAPGGSRNWGTVIGSKLGLDLPSLPRGWMRRRGLQELALPTN